MRVKKIVINNLCKKSFARSLSLFTFNIPLGPTETLLFQLMILNLRSVDLNSYLKSEFVLRNGIKNVLC